MIDASLRPAFNPYRPGGPLRIPVEPLLHAHLFLQLLHVLRQLQLEPHPHLASHELDLPQAVVTQVFPFYECLEAACAIGDVCATLEGRQHGPELGEVHADDAEEDQVEEGHLKDQQAPIEVQDKRDKSEYLDAHPPPYRWLQIEWPQLHISLNPFGAFLELLLVDVISPEHRLILIAHYVLLFLLAVLDGQLHAIRRPTELHADVLHSLRPLILLSQSRSRWWNLFQKVIDNRVRRKILQIRHLHAALLVLEARRSIQLLLN